jgi:hypothetical protein
MKRPARRGAGAAATTAASTGPPDMTAGNGLRVGGTAESTIGEPGDFRNGPCVPSLRWEVPLQARQIERKLSQSLQVRCQYRAKEAKS